MLFHHAFERAARQLPHKVALVDGHLRVTYETLSRKVATLARALRGDGVAPGDRVLIYLDNSVEYAVAVHAVLDLGAVFVPVSPMAKAEKLRFVAADSRASALVTHAHLAESWVPAIAEIP